MDKYINILTNVCYAIIISVPLVYALVTFVIKSVKSKNWKPLVDLLQTYMSVAEQKFTDGATRKEWVMAMIKASAEFVNYNISDTELSNLIDELCAFTKTMNVPSKAK